MLLQLVEKMMDKNERWLGGQGFSLVELMIVVTIVGIIAAIAVPGYMSYIHRTRVFSLVFPGMHSIEQNIALYYLSNSAMPDNTVLPELMSEADTTYFTVRMEAGKLLMTIDSPEPVSKLYILNGLDLTATPRTDGDKINGFALTGSLAERLKINE